MKKVFTLLFIGLPFLPAAQNVGVGTATPAEKLDVNGNINVSGTIKVNGVDGTANQVLMKNSGGNLSWGSIGDFKKATTFVDTANAGTWIVPSGVTRIFVEMWGGGGAGMEDGGGGGGYLALLFDNLSAGNTFTIGVGKGGSDVPTVAGGFTNGKSGTASTFLTPGNGEFDAYGGSGAFKNPSSQLWVPGDGGTFGYTFGAFNFPFYYYQQGQSGAAHDIAYYATVSGQYNVVKTYGAGGVAANTSNTGGSGAKKVENVNGVTTTTTYYVVAKPGKFPGGGGGGGEALNIYDNRRGANGMVIIHY
jgi:hypothetical protein